jgi:hypothetical protein
MNKYENFIYCEKQKCIFAYVPKAACTNWKCIFRYLAGSEDYLNCQLAHIKDSNLLYLNKIADYDNLLFNDEIKKYSCVRNPYSRVLSAYLNKIYPYVLNSIKNKTYYFKVFSEILIYKENKFPHKSNVDFDCFVNWLWDSKKNANKFDVHWRPQSELIDYDNIKYDFIAKIENINEDADFILKSISCDIKFPNQMNIKFAPNHSDKKLTLFYTTEIKEKIDFIYSQDFINFNYEKVIYGL